MSKKNKKRIKFDLQKVFCFSSFFFILGCIIIYGGTFIKLYLDNEKELENLKKTTVLAEQLINNNYDSLKNINKNYYFNGNTNNNYISYSNLIWRIVKINEDNSMMLVTDNIIGTLAYGDISTLYNESNLISWLNDNNKFSKILNKREEYLKRTSTCIDNITDIKNITCNEVNNKQYVGLLSLEDYLNTGGNTSFINNNKYSYLANKSDDNIWYINNDGSIDKSNGSDILGIKATITLNNSINIISGNGTKEEPYIIEKENNLIGSYVKLDNDLWRIYESNDNIIKLVLNNNITDTTHQYSNKTYYHNDTIKNSLAYYLNTTYYNNLSYKNLIIENTYVNGLYGMKNNFNYKDISSKTIETKVSIPSIDDIILSNEIDNYFTNTGKLENEEAIYVRSIDGIASSRLITTSANIVPCISINKDKLTLGTGTIADPYRTE